MHNRDNFIYRLKQQFRKYQTRRQLRRLPDHLFKDIARSPQQINKEIQKSCVVNLLLTALRRLINGR